MYRNLMFVCQFKILKKIIVSDNLLNKNKLIFKKKLTLLIHYY